MPAGARVETVHASRFAGGVSFCCDGPGGEGRPGQAVSSGMSADHFGTRDPLLVRATNAARQRDSGRRISARLHGRRRR
jgi:hypothetical protein